MLSIGIGRVRAPLPVIPETASNSLISYGTPYFLIFFRDPLKILAQKYIRLSISKLNGSLRKKYSLFWLEAPELFFGAFL